MPRGSIPTPERNPTSGGAFRKADRGSAAALPCPGGGLIRAGFRGGTMHRVPADPEALSLRTPHGAVPLGFAKEGTTVYLVARERSAQWPVDLLRAGRAELALPDGPARGRAEMIVDPAEKARVLRLFADRYGAERYRRWYEHPARVVRVDLDALPGAAGPDRDCYYRWLTAEFDNIAEEYDHHITGNRMNRLLRDRSLAWLAPRFAGRRRLLEVGCGSGLETLALLRAGHEVVAVDISPKMLGVVRAKADAEALGGRLTTVEGRAGGLDQLVDRLGAGSFDGAYSTYGAINCEPDIAPIVRGLARLLGPGAPFVAGVYNRWCVFEILGYSLTGRFARATGRATNPVPVGASRFCVDVYAYSAAEFRSAFRGDFRWERTEGVPVLLPPSDLVGYSERFARRFNRLAALDAWIGPRWPFNGLGDHFLMTFVRGGEAGPPGPTH